eukprot:1527428-Pleurochrysis_carterae.AAC.1
MLSSIRQKCSYCTGVLKPSRVCFTYANAALADCPDTGGVEGQDVCRRSRRKVANSHAPFCRLETSALVEALRA